ncbi:uncharacterized protein LOC126336312 [Schistocerca gregaria]|uniref:uncharacterized protein LOC126336312 n=1 Tax=Schistocerca gregaria TaxID=7010 RepID=UPI00211DCA3C|nr:uncharacterized protein LOC126336312 [Schistocerca gregaria]XP_049855810.1 uncharacterized protein LOC126336312 [Schistocerca gregaria]
MAPPPPPPTAGSASEDEVEILASAEDLDLSSPLATMDSTCTGAQLVTAGESAAYSAFPFSDMDNVNLLWNCSGFFYHLSELRQLLSLHPFLCIVLEETWFPVLHTPALHGCRGYYRNRAAYERGSVGICIYFLHSLHSESVPLQTPLEVVAVRVWMPQAVNVYSLYLPPDVDVPQHVLAALIAQLPTHFVLLGDLNAHNPLWDGTVATGRGSTVEHVLAQFDLFLLNDSPFTHFSVAHGTYPAIDLSICSASLLPSVQWSVHDDLCGSDHFLICLSLPQHLSSRRPCRWAMNKADWDLFSSIATFEPLSTDAIDAVVHSVAIGIITAAESAIPCSSGTPRWRTVPRWSPEIAEAIKDPRQAPQRCKRHP